MVFLCEWIQTSTLHLFFPQQYTDLYIFFKKYGFLYLGKVFLCEIDKNFNFSSVFSEHSTVWDFRSGTWIRVFSAPLTQGSRLEGFRGHPPPFRCTYMIHHMVKRIFVLKHGLGTVGYAGISQHN